jgi:hypothetical protein
VRTKTKKALKLSAHHASLALQMLVEDGKIAAKDVTAALKRREKTIRELRARLSALGEDVASTVAKTAAREAPRARRAITQAQRRARQAQGRYLAAIRKLSRQARVQVREIRAKSGVDAAIRAALKMTPRSSRR